jgi:hypothetical protein
MSVFARGNPNASFAWGETGPNISASADLTGSTLRCPEAGSWQVAAEVPGTAAGFAATVGAVDLSAARAHKPTIGTASAAIATASTAISIALLVLIVFIASLSKNDLPSLSPDARI